MKINIITRCTRIQNLKTVKDSVFKIDKPDNVAIEWHIVFDTKVLKDIDADILNTLDDGSVQFHFRKGDGWGLSQLNNLIHSLEGWIYHLDDDNILHPEFYTELSKVVAENSKTKGIIFSQKISHRDFTGLRTREAKPENVKVRHIDLAQWLIHSDLHKDYSYGSGYTADGEFIEKIYNANVKSFVIHNKILCYYNHLEKKSTAKVPKVLYIGPGEPVIKTTKVLDYEADELLVKYMTDDQEIQSVLVSFNPDAIITIADDWNIFNNLKVMPVNIRRRWVNLKPNDKLNIGDVAYECAMTNILKPSYLNDEETISFFTPIYNTGEKLLNTYNSLRDQTYGNWEWVIVNDSTDGGKTLKIAEEIAAQDPRVVVYDFREKSGGNIGEVKYRACVLAKGYILAELDHDDLLVPWCAEDLHKAAQKHPECGFFFNDTMEVDQRWNSLTYPEGFALGYGKYRDEVYNGKTYKVATQHNINPKTIRHIVGVPNHVRAWRRTTYFEIGGHNRGLTIADDYELVIRTFLHTTMCKIPKLGYIQFIYDNEGGTNTHNLSRADIQRRVRTIAEKYNEQIKNRFEELGLKDWAYEGNPHYPIMTPSQFGDDEQVANIIYKE